MRFRATRCAYGRFAMTYCDYGCTNYGGAANGAVGHGSASRRVSASSSRRSESYILIPAYALPPPIHGELLKLGFEISESTVSRYLAQATSPRDSGQRWLTFLKNQREALAAMDFFPCPPRPSGYCTAFLSS